MDRTVVKAFARQSGRDVPHFVGIVYLNGIPRWSMIHESLHGRSYEPLNFRSKGAAEATLRWLLGNSEEGVWEEAWITEESVTYLKL